MIVTSDKTATNPNLSYHLFKDFPPTSRYLFRKRTDVSSERTEKNNLATSETELIYISNKYNIKISRNEI
jgi:hypothetical protein